MNFMIFLDFLNVRSRRCTRRCTTAVYKGPHHHYPGTPPHCTVYHYPVLHHPMLSWAAHVQFTRLLSVSTCGSKESFVSVMESTVSITVSITVSTVSITVTVMTKQSKQCSNPYGEMTKQSKCQKCHKLQTNSQNVINCRQTVRKVSEMSWF